MECRVFFRDKFFILAYEFFILTFFFALEMAYCSGSFLHYYMHGYLSHLFVQLSFLVFNFKCWQAALPLLMLDTQ